MWWIQVLSALLTPLGLLLPVFADAGELFSYRLRKRTADSLSACLNRVRNPLRVPSPERKRPGLPRIGDNVLPFGAWHIEYTEFREKPLPYWLVCFADTASGPIQHLFFAGCCRTEKSFNRRYQKGYKSQCLAGDMSEALHHHTLRQKLPNEQMWMV